MLSSSNTFLNNKYFSLKPASVRERRNTLLTLLTILIIGLISVYYNPFEILLTDVLKIQSVNGCPLLTFTNIPCPMCGMGRVFSCMTDFYIAKSFYYNPLGLAFYLVFGIIFCVILVLSLQKKKLVLTKQGYKLWYIPVIFLAAMWILNILFGHHH